MCRIELSTFFNFIPDPSGFPKHTAISFWSLPCDTADHERVRMYIGSFVCVCVCILYAHFSFCVCVCLCVCVCVLSYINCAQTSLSATNYNCIPQSVSIVLFPQKNRHIAHNSHSLICTWASDGLHSCLSHQCKANAEPVPCDLSYRLLYKHKHHLPQPATGKI